VAQAEQERAKLQETFLRMEVELRDQRLQTERDRYVGNYWWTLLEPFEFQWTLPCSKMVATASL
jgi:hypothetical protein